MCGGGGGGGASALFLRRLSQGRVTAEVGGVKPTAVVFRVVRINSRATGLSSHIKACNR